MMLVEASYYIVTAVEYGDGGGCIIIEGVLIRGIFGN